jgi:hypothetical protein
MDQIPITDRTCFELVLTLELEGWAWHRWVPPSARRPSHVVIPDAYRQNAPKFFSTTEHASQLYLQVLGLAEVSRAGEAQCPTCSPWWAQPLHAHPCLLKYGQNRWKDRSFISHYHFYHIYIYIYIYVYTCIYIYIYIYA